MANKPKLLATPELNTMLTPNRLANISVTLRPSIKLNITPHIQPSDKPFKNMAATLNGGANKPKPTKAASAATAEQTKNLKRRSFFNSEINLMPKNLAIT